MELHNGHGLFGVILAAKSGSDMLGQYVVDSATEVSTLSGKALGFLASLFIALIVAIGTGLYSLGTEAGSVAVLQDTLTAHIRRGDAIEEQVIFLKEQCARTQVRDQTMLAEIQRIGNALDRHIQHTASAHGGNP